MSSGPLKAAWALTAFVILAGVVLWATTGRAVFAVFIVLGALTAAGAWFTGRSQPAGDTGPAAPGGTSSKENDPS